MTRHVLFAAMALVVFSCSHAGIPQEAATGEEPAVTPETAVEEASTAKTPGDILKEMEMLLREVVAEGCPGVDIGIERGRVYARWNMTTIDVGEHISLVGGGCIHREMLMPVPGGNGYSLYVRVGTGTDRVKFDKPRQCTLFTKRQIYMVSHRIEWREDTHILIQLSYGKDVNQDLIQKIKEALAAYASG